MLSITLNNEFFYGISQLSAILLSVGLGLFIGYERELQNKPAGIRDITLVTLGACIFTLIARRVAAVNPNNDLGRIISYTISSIGFLGSGAIIQNKGDVEGITTAATLWSSVAIGLLCGMGDLFLAIITSILIYGVLKLKYLQVKIEGWRKKKDEKDNRH